MQYTVNGKVQQEGNRGMTFVRNIIIQLMVQLLLILIHIMTLFLVIPLAIQSPVM